MGDSSELTSSASTFKGVRPWSGKLPDPTAQHYLLWRASIMADAREHGFAAALQYASEADFLQAQTPAGGTALTEDGAEQLVERLQALKLALEGVVNAQILGKPPGLIPAEVYEKLITEDERKLAQHELEMIRRKKESVNYTTRGEIPKLCFTTQQIRAVNRLVNQYTSDLAKMLVHAEVEPFIMMQKLDLRYGARGNVGKDKIDNEWTSASIKQEKGEEPLAYVQRVEDVARRWNTHELVRSNPDLKKEDFHIRDKIIAGLTADYIQFQTTWDRERDTGKFVATLSDIASQLQSYYARVIEGHKTDDEDNAEEQLKGKGMKGVGNLDWLKDATCYNCRRKGHLARDCTSKCIVCDKKGHLRKDCPNTKPKKKSRKTKAVESSSSDSEDERAIVKALRKKKLAKVKAKAKVAKLARHMHSDSDGSDTSDTDADSDYEAYKKMTKKKAGKVKMAKVTVEHQQREAPNVLFHSICQQYEQLEEAEVEWDEHDNGHCDSQILQSFRHSTTDPGGSEQTDYTPPAMTTPVRLITSDESTSFTAVLVLVVTALIVLYVVVGLSTSYIINIGIGISIAGILVYTCRNLQHVKVCKATMQRRKLVRFFLDTGATHTCLRNKQHLHTIRTTHLTIEGIHNSQVYDTMGASNVVFQGSGGNDILALLQDVVWTPDINEDILAWVQLKQLGFHLHDIDTEAWLTSPEGHKIPLITVNGLIYVDVWFGTGGQVKASSGKKEMTQLHFHESFGHVRNPKVLLKAALKQSITLTDCRPVIECNSCSLQDIQRRHVSKVSSERSREPGGRVFMDLTGKINLKARDGRTSTIAVALDDCTSRGFLSGLAGKAGKYTSEMVKNVVDEFKMMGVPIKKIRTDAGKEWLNNKVKQVAADNGIKREITSPYTPEQNARVERRIVQIFRLALKLLQTGGFYGNWRVFWLFACLHSCYSINYRPTRANGNNMSPMEMWAATTKSKYVPMINVPFGSIVYLIKHDKKKEDMDDRGEEAMFLGVAEELGRGSILFKLKSRKIIITEHYTYHTNKIRYAPKEYPNLHDWNTDGNEIAEMFAEALSDGMEEDTIINYQREEDNGITVHVPVVEENIEIVFHDSTNDIGGNVQHVEPSLTAGEVFGTNGEETVITENHDINIDNAPEETTNMTDDQHTSTDNWCGVSDENILEGKRNRVARLLTIDLTEYGMIKQAITTIVAKASHYVPKTYKDVLNMKDKEERRLWIYAICEELGTLKARGVWKVKKRPLNKKVIKSMLVFALKINGVDGSIERRKARWVAKDYAGGQTSYVDVFAPVIGSSTAKLIIAKSIQPGFRFHQWDVKNAYVLAPEPNEIYIEQPVMKQFQEGDPKEFVFRLIQSLYGTRTAGRNWNKMINNWLLAFGFKRSIVDACLYTLRCKDGKLLILGLYVDDIIMAENWGEMADAFEKKFTSSFEVKAVTNGNFLGCYMERKENGEREVTLTQATYWNTVLERFNMQHVRPRSTPITPGLMKRVFTAGELEPLDKNIPYRELVGSLLYGVIWTRPDLANAVRWLGSHAHNPKRIHWETGKGILRYIQSTKNEKLRFVEGDDTLSVYTDASYASEVDGRSVLGYAIFFNGGCITAKSRAEGIQLSTMDAEFSALSNGIKEVLALKDLMTDFCHQGVITAYCDNKSTISVIKSEGATKKSRLIRLRYMHAKTSVLSGEIQVVYIPTGEQVADILTKDLGKILVKKFRDCLLGKKVSLYKNQGEC